jgi:hypothetical protein
MSGVKYVDLLRVLAIAACAAYATGRYATTVHRKKVSSRARSFVAVAL